MVKMVRSELMKMRHTFAMKMIVAFPAVTLLMGYLLSGNSVQLAAYNWWYIIMLPITISIWCASMIVRERNTGYQNVLCLGTSLKRIYLAKMFAAAILLLISNLVMWGGCTVLGFLTVMNIGWFHTSFFGLLMADSAYYAACKADGLLASSVSVFWFQYSFILNWNREKLVHI